LDYKIDFTDLEERENFDLHLHTTASDGIYSPTEVVRKAFQKGITLMAITDHDTLAGIKEAEYEGIKLGVKVVAGIELSTKFKGQSVDVLGLDIRKEAPLSSTLEQLQSKRRERGKQIIEKFCQIGLPITLEDVQVYSKGHIVARPHIAKAVVEKGYVKDIKTVFDLFLGDGKPCSVDKLDLSPEEAIKLIHAAGGKAVLAHPVLIEDDDIVKELAQAPFDGIEVWHPKQNRDDQERYKKLARKHDLFITGGSDFHDDRHIIGEFGK
jgi:predicted metal-dependent phosphoesterase TrpH